AGSHLRRNGRRRSRGDSRRLSLDPCDGQPPHRLPALASLRREKELRPPHRIQPGHPNHPQKITAFLILREEYWSAKRTGIGAEASLPNHGSTRLPRPSFARFLCKKGGNFDVLNVQCHPPKRG